MCDYQSQIMCLLRLRNPLFVPHCVNVRVWNVRMCVCARSEWVVHARQQTTLPALHNLFIKWHLENRMLKTVPGSKNQTHAKAYQK